MEPLSPAGDLALGPLLDPHDPPAGPGGRRRPSDCHLVAGIPTPNGPTHLGHLGGPFLRLDMLARFLRLCGHRAFLVSGTDAHESHVRLASVRLGVPPQEIAARYHAEIERDLASLDVVQDAFIDPLHPRWSARYRGWHRCLLDRLQASGRVEVRRERVLVARADGRHLVGAFVAGRCPECGRDVVGGSCEECGMWFSPDCLVAPRPASGLPGVHGVSDVDTREVSNLYLRLGDAELARLLSAADLRTEHRDVVLAYLAREGPLWALTQQSDWGVAAPSATPSAATPAATPPAVFATYGLGILAYAALCGEEFGRLSGTGINALAPGSGVVAVSAQGFDSIVPDAFALTVLDSLAPVLRRYDHLTLNRFLLLEGRKFSTSRRHAVWTREATQVIDSDVIRYHLARVSPDEGPTDFRVDEFAAAVDTHLVRGLDRRATACWGTLGAACGAPSGRPPGTWIELLERLLQRQRAALDPRRLRLAGVVEALDVWPTVGDTVGGTAGDTPDSVDVVDDAYWWLKGAAVLAWSVMPRWSRAVWNGLGHEGDPGLSRFWHTPPVSTGDAAARTRRRIAPLDVGLLRRLAEGDLTNV